jgi:nucleotide sugar dehydrogenase
LPDILQLKPTDIDTAEKRAHFKVCVVGCGKLGALYAALFAAAGFSVFCTDPDQSLLKKLTKRGFVLSEEEIRSFVRTGILSTTGDVKSAVAQSDIILLTSGAKVDEKSNLEFLEAENNCKQIGAGLQRGALVVFAGLAGFGFTEDVIKEKLEEVSGLTTGTDFGLAYVYGSIGDANNKSELTVAANDQASLNGASLILSTTTKSNVRQISGIKIGELATLFAASLRNVSTAFMNEFAVFCEKAGLDVFEVLNFLKGCLGEADNSPTISNDGELETRLLLESAENLEVNFRLNRLAIQVKRDTVRHAVNLTQGVLRDCGKTLRRARIAVLGGAAQGSSAEAFVEMLIAKGARINIYFPRSGKYEEPTTMVVPKRSVVEAVENCDCIVFLAAEEQFRRLSLKSLRSIMKSPACVVDIVGLFEREKVENEGFLYRGLGRGVERK